MKFASKISLAVIAAVSFSGCAFATESVEKPKESAAAMKVEPVKVENVKVDNVKVEPVSVKVDAAPIKVEPIKIETLKVEMVKKPEPKVEAPKKVEPITLSVIGMGVYPESTISQAQSVAMAKRAAIVDGYRQLTEKVYGVHIDGMDFIRNMVTKRSDLRATVQGVLKYANVVETVCRDGACQVELELKIDPTKLKNELASL